MKYMIKSSVATQFIVVIAVVININSVEYWITVRYGISKTPHVN